MNVQTTTVSRGAKARGKKAPSAAKTPANRKGKTSKRTLATEPAEQAHISKQTKVIQLLRRPGGATIDDLVAATGWQPHSVRGAMSGALKKKLNLTIESEKIEGQARIYRIP